MLQQLKKVDWNEKSVHEMCNENCDSKAQNDKSNVCISKHFRLILCKLQNSSLL